MTRAAPDRPLALVTGGCRRLGAAIAAALATDGYDLAIHGGSDSVPEAGLLAAIAQAGAEFTHFPADLADADAVTGLIPAVVARFGRPPDLLVNNAARFDYDSPDDVTQAGLLDHYKVNTVAPILLARAMAEQAGAERAGGDRPVAIVNILDQRIAAPNGDQLSYTLSKLALSEATTILARHFAPHVRICAVAPGLTLPSPDYDGARWAAAARHMPLARLATPREVADAVLFLARSSSVTGQVLFVDAGAHLRQYPRDFPFLDETGHI
jgi:NAD(P)-dependent dehydrogenase (short-subunit alcohol dehydrogenase family)